MASEWLTKRLERNRKRREKMLREGHKAWERWCEWDRVVNPPRDLDGRPYVTREAT